MEIESLKKIRLLQQLTLEELAHRLNISKQAVNAHELGFENGGGIRLSVLRQHLQAMGVELTLTITLPTGERLELQIPQK